MKDKILQSLRNKYKNLGLSESVLAGMADMIAINTTEESNIETAVAGVENLAKSFQSEADRIRTEATLKAKAESKGGESQEKKPAETETKNEDVPAWAKGLIESNKSLSEQLNAIKSGTTTTSRKSVLETKLKDAPESFKSKILKDFDRMAFGNDDDFNAYLTETETDLGAVTQEFANKGLSAHQSPITGGGATEASLDADIKAWSGAENK
jgi:predicted outer membrane protein